MTNNKSINFNTEWFAIWGEKNIAHLILSGRSGENIYFFYGNWIIYSLIKLNSFSKFILHIFKLIY